MAAVVGPATAGAGRLRCKVTSGPARIRSRHVLRLSGDVDRAAIEIEAQPSPHNPRSVLIAAVSVAALRNKYPPA